jgi:hypothetical protein
MAQGNPSLHDAKSLQVIALHLLIVGNIIDREA